MILFTLSMPNIGSWNGQWSGAGGRYAQTRPNPSKEKRELIFKDKEYASFYYNFGDGWGASVEAKLVTAAEANKAMRKSQGFCGYDWMIDEIMEHGRIIPLSELFKKSDNERADQLCARSPK